MARYVAETRFIASIYPGVLPVVRRHYGPSRESGTVGSQRQTVFQLQPVKRGEKPFVMPVYDSFEDVLDVMAMSGSRGNPQKPRMPKPVPVEEIVRDVLNEWTGSLFNVPNGAKPGIMEISPLPADMRAWEKEGKLPTVSLDEQRQMLEMQAPYFEYLFQEGEKLHKQNNWKEITDTMRLAAEWLGPDFHREWSHHAIAREAGPCPWCSTIISNTAIVCSHCGRQVRDTPSHLLKFANGGQPEKRI